MGESTALGIDVRSLETRVISISICGCASGDVFCVHLVLLVFVVLVIDASCCRLKGILISAEVAAFHG